MRMKTENYGIFVILTQHVCFANSTSTSGQYVITKILLHPTTYPTSRNLPKQTIHQPLIIIIEHVTQRTTQTNTN